MNENATWINWLRSGSQLFAGIKITMAFLSYIGVGQIGKWLFETFYPFTRLLWADFFKWLSLPEISDIEKDSLTALMFFIPLGISAIISKVFGAEEDVNDQDHMSDRRTALIVGSVFVFLICSSLWVGLRAV